ERDQGYQLRQLYVMNRDGSGSRVVLGNFDRDVDRPRWAPDSSGLYFLSSDKGNTGLHFATLEGKVTQVARDIGSGLHPSGVVARRLPSQRTGRLPLHAAAPTCPATWPSAA